jgi:putative exosortase-associated protein (TIGR04073 family)
MRVEVLMKMLTVVLMVLFVSAGVSEAKEKERAEDIIQDMSTKLNRGVVNILTGWVELPRQMVKAGRDKSWWASVPVGVPAGVMMTVGRTGVGVFETVFFFIPTDDSYDPILEPGYVWQ